MNAADLARLHHMLDAAQEAISFAENRTLKDLHRDRMLLLSLVKEIEIIGEAASRISPEGRAAIAGIPWPQMMAMRNRLTHGYFDWDTETIWATVTSDTADATHMYVEVEQLLVRRFEHAQILVFQMRIMILAGVADPD